ncbi:unnamed protein product [Mesocestoides corti]|uniref:Uncharacterized protein n=1 Tax=Mesocestoides corti TaxID=53468 RepID=A0A0R3UMG1_MESCO|nr:unnamed protein product [Mesocestoides corti]
MGDGKATTSPRPPSKGSADTSTANVSTDRVPRRRFNPRDDGSSRGACGCHKTGPAQAHKSCLRAHAQVPFQTP